MAIWYFKISRSYNLNLDTCSYVQTAHSYSICFFYIYTDISIWFFLFSKSSQSQWHKVFTKLFLQWELSLTNNFTQPRSQIHTVNIIINVIFITVVLASLIGWIGIYKSYPTNNIFYYDIYVRKAYIRKDTKIMHTCNNIWSFSMFNT